MVVVCGLTTVEVFVVKVKVQVLALVVAVVNQRCVTHSSSSANARKKVKHYLLN